MKKVLFLAAVLLALFVSNNSNAQVVGKEIINKNEISLSYGVMSNSQWADFLENLYLVLVDAHTNTKRSIGPVGIEYFNHITPLIAVGAVGTVTSIQDDLRDHNDIKLGEINRTYYTIMPAIKFNWLRKEHFGMYSKLAAGVSFVDSSLKDVDPGSVKDKDKDAMFNYQASVLGLEFGGAFRGFAEFGIGEQGMVLIGVRYNF